VNLRPYQLAALAALQDHWRAGGGAALLDMATATGKSLVIAETVRRRHAVDPSLRSIIAVQSEFRLHRKRGDAGAPPTLRVDYLSGFSVYSEYVSFESVNSYARQFARNWWVAMGGGSPVPPSVIQAIERQHELDHGTEIQVSRDDQYWRINRRRVRRTDGSVFDVDHKYRCTRIAA
jgi:hypothetical protein